MEERTFGPRDQAIVLAVASRLQNRRECDSTLPDLIQRGEAAGIGRAQIEQAIELLDRDHRSNDSWRPFWHVGATMLGVQFLLAVPLLAPNGSSNSYAGALAAVTSALLATSLSGAQRFARTCAVLSATMGAATVVAGIATRLIAGELNGRWVESLSAILLMEFGAAGFALWFRGRNLRRVPSTGVHLDNGD